jgi:hypothetical protein
MYNFLPQEQFNSLYSVNDISCQMLWTLSVCASTMGGGGVQVITLRT